jgi:hypothetical protein
MNFDPWNISLKIWDFIVVLSPKVRVHLGVHEFIPSHSWECKCDSQIALSDHTFPCLCVGYEFKIKVVTFGLPI